MTKNERIAEFAAKLIEQGRNPILAVFDAMAALDPKPGLREYIVHSVRDCSPPSTRNTQK
jgi:hypothetical protein